MDRTAELLGKLRAVEARAVYLEMTAYADPSHYRRENKLRKVRNLQAQAQRIKKLLERMGVDPNSAQ
mgnify:CR=1 FL=1